MPKHEWMIWSNEHNAWWRANALGYTPDRSSAGKYTLEDACRIVYVANQYLQDDQDPNETLVRYENIQGTDEASQHISKTETGN